MVLVGRRDFLGSLGLGAAATLLSPFCSRLIRSARGAALSDARLLFFTANQGWNSEADDDDVRSDTPKGQRSRFFNTSLRSTRDFDLPDILEPLTPWRAETSILFGLKNFLHTFDGVPHGSGWSTLTALPGTDDGEPTGISIDRYLGKELQKKHGDLIDSATMSTLMYGQYPTAMSADGPRKEATVYVTPLKAYAAFFGKATATAPSDVTRLLARNKSLFDGMVADIDRARGGLAPTDRQKLDQLTDSTRELERKLSMRLSAGGRTGKPPAPTVDASDLKPEVITAFLDVAVQVQAYGLTHVSHFALHGTSAESDTRRYLVPGIRSDDTHNGVYHEDLQPDIKNIVLYQARQIAYVRKQLDALDDGGAPLSAKTLIVWLNAGGYQHHRGHHAHPMVLVGSLGGALKTPSYVDYTRIVTGSDHTLEGERHIADAFVTLANAAGVPMTTFGDGASCQGALPEVLA